MENINVKSKDNFKNIFDRVISTIQDKIESEIFFADKILQIPLRLLFKTAMVNFQGVLFLCDSSEEGRTLIYLNCPPLNRSLFDNLFQTVLLLEDTQTFSKQFHQTRLKEAKEIHQFRENEYGIDIDGTNHITELEKIVDDEWELTQNQKEDFKKLFQPKSTNQIANEFTQKNLPVAPLLKYLVQLYYWNLSQVSHSQPTAFIPLYHQIIQSDDKKRDEFRNREKGIAMNLMLCLLSEIEIHLNLGLKQDLLDLWIYKKEECAETAKLFEMRYETLLTA